MSTSTRRVAVTALVALIASALAWLAYTYGYEQSGGDRVAWTDVTSGLAEPEFTRPAAKVFRQREDLERFLDSRAPIIDFARREAILVASGPRSSTAYRLEVVSVTEERGRIVVTVRERAPTLADPGRPGLTYPYRLITVPKSNKDVHLAWPGRP